MSLDDHISEVVQEAIDQKLGAYLKRLADPEPLVYNVEEAARVMRTSTNTIRRLLSENVLPTVPHMGDRVLIPRKAVDHLVNSAQPDGNKENRHVG